MCKIVFYYLSEKDSHSTPNCFRATPLGLKNTGNPGHSKLHPKGIGKRRKKTKTKPKNTTIDVCLGHPKASSMLKSMKAFRLEINFLAWPCCYWYTRDNLPHYVKTQYLYFRFYANYFFTLKDS